MRSAILGGKKLFDIKMDYFNICVRRNHSVQRSIALKVCWPIKKKLVCSERRIILKRNVMHLAYLYAGRKCSYMTGDP